MLKSEVRNIKRVVLFVKYDVIYEQDTQEDANPIEDSEVARSLKRVYFIDDVVSTAHTLTGVRRG